jgi:hypothetical protein
VNPAARKISRVIKSRILIGGFLVECYLDYDLPK